MKASTLGILLVVLCLSRMATADTHYVSPTGPAIYPFTTPETAATVIQDAVHAAQYGDVVQLMPGEYRQRVVLKAGVRLWGSGEDRTTIIALEEGAYQAAVTGAQAAEVRNVGFLREQAGPPTYPIAMDLAGGPDQAVADCAVRGGFSNGIVVRGPSQGLSALVYRCSFDGPDAGMKLTGGGPRACVDACTFRYGCPLVGGSGLLLATRSEISGVTVVAADVLLDSCSLGGVVMDGVGSLRMANCLVRGAGGYAVLANSALMIEMYFCTIVGTEGLFCDSVPRVYVRNTILWGDPPQFQGADSSCLTAEFCDVKGGWEGAGNIDADPMLVDPEKGDFRLRPESPCIDILDGYADITQAVPWLPKTDIRGLRRVAYGGRHRRPDMGAYEYHINRIALGPVPGQTTLTWSCAFFETYSVFYSDDLLTWHLADGSVGPGYDEVVLSWTDDGSLTGVPPSLVPRRFYRILENP